MPSNFFQKFVKAPNGHDRRSSDGGSSETATSRRTSTSRRRTESSTNSNSRGASPLPSEPVPPLPPNASSLGSKFNTGASQQQQQQPNVKVVPPSPQVSVTEDGVLVEGVPKEQNGGSRGGRIIDGLPGGNEATGRATSTSPSSFPPTSNGLPDAADVSLSVQAPTPELRGKSSKKSLTKGITGKPPSRPGTANNEQQPQQQQHQQQPVGHSSRTPSVRERAATMPTVSNMAVASAEEVPPVPLIASTSNNQIADSPTELHHPTGLSATLDSPASKTAPNAATVVPPREPPKKKQTAPGGARGWRPGGQKKPTGLASAIAASGLSMANPAVSRQLSPPPSGQHRRPSAAGIPALGMNGSPQPSGTSIETSPRSRHSRRGSTSKRRHGSVSMSVASDGVSANGEDAAEANYYSGLDTDSSDEEDSASEREGLMDLDFGEDNLPVTGFAVASVRRNQEFHELFPTVPEGDYLIEDYGCALQREILIQGRLYISENHICFYANIFGWITSLSVPIHEVTSLEKKMTAFVIPNAILIATRQNKYSFASFLSRDTTYDVIYNIWRLTRPSDAASMVSSGHESVNGLDGMIEGTTVGAGEEGVVVQGNVVGKVKKKVTQCSCGKKGEHYTETAMDAVFPGTPDRIHNLIFTSGFMKDFLAVNQKLTDIQVSDWAPLEPGSRLLARNMSYIKPLNAPVGPKSTKCEIRDETLYVDFEDHVTTLTTTRTPDVPSGGVFSVKTKTCITFAGAMSSKVLVTTQVEWTGRSFIKGIIERSAIDGQKVYHTDLEKAMRTYIQEHQTEFLPEGMDVAALAPVADEVPSPTTDGPLLSAEEKGKQREKDRNQRSLQWAYDTFDGARRVAVDSTKGALELVRDAWDQSTTTTILYFLIVLLVFSNIYTLTRMGAKEEIGRKKEMRKNEEREKWVQGVVTAIWDELATGKIQPGGGGNGNAASLGSAVLDGSAAFDPANWKQEVNSLLETLDLVEKRTGQIKTALVSIRENVEAQDADADID